MRIDLVKICCAIIGNTVSSRTLIRLCSVDDVCGGIYLIKTWINMMILKDSLIL